MYRMGKKLDPIENAGFRKTLFQLRGTTLTARCNVLPAHPATTSEFKQFEFFDLTGMAAIIHEQGRPGKSSPANIAFLSPKPPLQGFTKAIGLRSSLPSWRSGKTHGFCVTGGHSPIASEPTPSPRLWAAALD